MTCLRCQTFEAAEATDNVEGLVRELYRQIDRLTDLTLDAAIRGVPIPPTGDIQP